MIPGSLIIAALQLRSMNATSKRRSLASAALAGIRSDRRNRTAHNHPARSSPRGSARVESELLGGSSTLRPLAHHGIGVGLVCLLPDDCVSQEDTEPLWSH